MRHLLFAAALLAVSACNCGGRPPNQLEDGGFICGPDSCLPCPTGTTTKNVCELDAGWNCRCEAADGGAVAVTYCDDLARRECDFFARCHSEALEAFDVTQGRGNTNQVAAGERARCEARLKDQGCVIAAQGISLGRLTLDRSRYNECAEAAFPAATCARDLNQVLARCSNFPDKFLQGTVAAGALCTEDQECKAGFCTVTGGNACGTCSAYLTSGNCNRDAQCDPATSYCPGPDGTTLGACATYTAVDQPCSALDVQNNESCGPGKVCTLTGVGLSAKCAPAKLEGEPCVKGRFECQRSGRGRAELTCATVNAMDKCTKIQAGAGGLCGTGETFIGVGTAPFCLETEYCSQQVCTARRDATQPCPGGNGTCKAGTRCVNQVCEAFKDADAACQDSAECKNFLSCVNGKCTSSFALLGESCTQSTTRPCAEGFCQTSGTAATCVALKAEGAGCSAPAECASYACASTCQNACWD